MSDYYVRDERRIIYVSPGQRWKISNEFLKNNCFGYLHPPEDMEIAIFATMRAGHLSYAMSRMPFGASRTPVEPMFRFRTCEMPELVQFPDAPVLIYRHRWPRWSDFEREIKEFAYVVLEQYMRPPFVLGVGRLGAISNYNPAVEGFMNLPCTIIRGGLPGGDLPSGDITN